MTTTSRALCICGHPQERHIIPMITRGLATHLCLDCMKMGFDCRMFRTERTAPPDHFLPPDKLAKVVELVQRRQADPDSGWPDVWSPQKVERALLWPWPIDYQGGWQQRDDWLQVDSPERLAAIVLAPLMA